MTFGSNYRESDKIFCQENTFRNNVWKVAVIFFRLQCVIRDYFVHAASQWETTLQCNVVSHWLAAYTKWSLCCMYLAPMESESCHLLSVLHWSINSLWPETCFNIYICLYFYTKTVFPGMEIPIIKIRQSQDHLIFTMGIPILAIQHLYI